MIQLKRKANYTFIATDGTHSLVSDASIGLGGENLGMDPHRLLEAALASCTAITVQMYANRKGWPLLDSQVEVQFVSEGAETVISRKIQFKGDLDDSQKQRLLEIANKCPIHKVLTGTTIVQTSLV